MLATLSQKIGNGESSMPTTSRALLTEIIDYAGLFPPAKLPMEEAFTRFLGHLGSDDGWLLARFVCPATRLEELASLIETADLVQTPLRIAALGAGGDDPPTFAAAMETDLEAMATFNARVQGKATIDVFEVKLPDQGDPSEVVDFSCHHLEELGNLRPKPFFEIPLLGSWRDHLRTIAPAVAAAGHEIDGARRVGLKIRCGGLDAAAVPSVEAVAATICESRNAALAMKATQGLHHPIRHFDSALETKTHGFLNLFTASVLALSHSLDEAEVRKIIAEEDAAAFALTETELRWRDRTVGFEEVVNGRTATMTSFGSCSFSEPRDDLSLLGLL